MSYIKTLPWLLLILAGCAAAPRHAPEPGGAAAGPAASASADEELARYRSAITALNNSQLEYAQTELRRITAHRPELAGPWLNLALVDVRKNDIEGARKHLAQALVRNPKMPQAFNLRGYIELAHGDVTKAAEDYRQAIALKEDYAIAHYNYALIHDIYFQDARVAVAHYKRYLELTGNQDKKTAEWVTELERQLTKESP
jgi:Flp pilus assembly protein TadD